MKRKNKMMIGFLLSWGAFSVSLSVHAQSLIKPLVRVTENSMSMNEPSTTINLKENLKSEQKVEILGSAIENKGKMEIQVLDISKESIKPSEMDVRSQREIEILNLSDLNDEQKIDEQLKNVERVSVKESLSKGEWIEETSYDACPEQVSRAELGLWVKVSGPERCALKSHINQESVIRALDKMMYETMCTDPIGKLADRYNKIMREAPYPQHMLRTKNKFFIETYERNGSVCANVAQNAELFSPVLSVRHVGVGKVQGKTCKAALVEGHILTGLAALGRFNFVVGMSECIGLVDWMPKANIWYDPSEVARIENGINAAFGWSNKNSKVRFVQPSLLKEPS